jgi:hypothetical protein
MKCKDLVKLMVIALVCLPLLTFGCKGKMEVAEEEEIIGEGEPGALRATGDVRRLPEISLPTASLTYVRLDGKEIGFANKPIPRAIRMRATFNRKVSDAELTVVEREFFLRRGEVHLGKSFEWFVKSLDDGTKVSVVTVTPERWFDHGTTYTAGIGDIAVHGGPQVTFTTAQWGDVNGDGYSDTVVGAYTADSGSAKGQAYVFHGTEGGVSTQPHIVIKGKADNDYVGYAVAMAGDINADGYADIVVGAYGAENYKGQVYVFHGSESGVFWNVRPAVTKPRLQKFEAKPLKVKPGRIAEVEAEPVPVGELATVEPKEGIGDRTIVEPIVPKICDLSADCVPGATISATAPAYLGVSVSSAGDINGDGYDDIIVGATDVAEVKGEAYIFLGSGGGIITEAHATIAGKAADDEIGNSVSGAGDVNGDGYDDVIVAAHGVGENAGQAYVFLGSEKGIVPEQNDRRCDLSTLNDCTPSTTITGQVARNNLGESVSGAGDVNGDGYDDVIVGAYTAAGDKGQAYVFLGSVRGISNCDLSAGCVPATTMSTGAEGDYLGRSVSGAGDVNGDGYDDILVSAYFAEERKGRAYVFLGSESGIGDCDLSADSPCTPPATITGAVAYSHPIQGNQLGSTVSRAGDVNGDGYDDIIVGALGVDDWRGQAYILHGSKDGINNCDLSTCAPNTTLTGEKADDRFGSVR